MHPRRTMPKKFSTQYFLDHQPTEVMDPTEKSLDSPTPAITAERTIIRPASQEAERTFCLQPGDSCRASLGKS
jgi:hypothetical protein